MREVKSMILKKFSLAHSSITCEKPEEQNLLQNCADCLPAFYMNKLFFLYFRSSFLAWELSFPCFDKLLKFFIWQVGPKTSVFAESFRLAAFALHAADLNAPAFFFFLSIAEIWFIFISVPSNCKTVSVFFSLLKECLLLLLWVSSTATHSFSLSSLSFWFTHTYWLLTQVI